MHINVPLRNAMVAAVATRFAAGRLRIYSGAKPATSNLAPTGTLLVDITLPNPAFAAAANGQIDKTGTWQDAAADATGTAGYARFSETGDTLLLDAAFARADLTVGTTGTEIILDNTSITAGQTVTINSGNLAQPAGT